MPVLSLRIAFKALILNSIVQEGDNGWKSLSGLFGSVFSTASKSRRSRAVQNRSGSNDAGGIRSRTKHYCARLMIPFSETRIS